MATKRYNRAMEYCDQLACNLKRLVDEGECSVIELARFADVSRGAIYQFLDRQCKDLGFGKAMAIADGLKIPLAELSKKDFRIPAKSA